MKFYAKYKFKQSPLSDNSYVLESQEGAVKGLFLMRYADTPKNYECGINGKEYIYFGVPRNPSIAKFFAHVFEGLNHKPITSTEGINEMNRTFGDAKQLGLSDLILFQFSEDRKSLDMWVVRGMGSSRAQKQKCFRNWCDGEELIPNID